MDDTERRLFVLDTNVLLHDPAALFRFQEHDLYLPMAVLEELDAIKKGSSEVARNARQVSRLLDQLIGGAGRAEIERGLPLPAPAEGAAAGVRAGRLFLQTDGPHPPPGVAPRTGSADNTILATTVALQERLAPQPVVLVSKDINLRIKARLLGLTAEDYASDQVLEDASLLYTGLRRLPPEFTERHAAHYEARREGERTVYTFRDGVLGRCWPNECLYVDREDGLEGVVRRIDGDTVQVEAVTDYRKRRHAVWGICARNREQNFALNLLMDPEIEFVTLLGTAGAGKTLLALAAGLSQTLEHKLYREIVMTRVTVSVGEDIGFLPGSEEEKMTPWMGALLDNLEVLADTDTGGDWGRAATADLLANRIKIRSLNFMRGRTFLNRYLIIDEAQNLTPKQMKTLITRAGPGTKIVCLGNIAQIDTPYLTETTSGLTYVVDRFRAWPHGAHLILTRGERSRLADFAAEVL